MKREVEITLRGDESKVPSAITLTGETVTYTLDDADFAILGKALELMHLTKGDRSSVGIILEAQFAMDGIALKGFVDAALAMYCDIQNYIVLSVQRR